MKCLDTAKFSYSDIANSRDSDNESENQNDVTVYCTNNVISTFAQV